VEQGHDAPPERAEIPLELSGVDDAVIDVVGVRVPERARGGWQGRSDARIRDRPAGVPTNAEELQKRVVVERANRRAFSSTMASCASLRSTRTTSAPAAARAKLLSPPDAIDRIRLPPAGCSP
jgi:hypothetical protein